MNNIKMNNLRKMGGVTALLASTLVFANSVEAISLIGNYPPTNDGGNTTITSGTTQKAVGFTLPTGTDYRLDSIVLRLSNYKNTDTPLLQIYADTARTSTSPSGLTAALVTFIRPANQGGSPALGNDFIFLPNPTTFTFNANTRYWLLVDATAGFYDWRASTSSPSITPAGISGITFNSYQTSATDGTIGSYGTDTNFSSFQINATAVPFEFEATGGLVMLGGAWLLHKHLQKKKT